MPEVKPRILVIDDEEDMLSLYKNILKNEFPSYLTTSGKEALSILSKEEYDVMILDVLMPEMSGLDVLKKAKIIDPTLEVIMVTASKDIKPAVDSIKNGAFDYVIKPFEIEDLLITIKKALERKTMLRENKYLKQMLDEKADPGDIIGKSEAIHHVKKMLNSISDSASTVLITGESGTGKEVVANALHKKSKRAKMPFIVVNCAAIPENLLESELFGHERGSFTGALERHVGKFELASGGTIFLDEIGEMPINMQAKLLRAVQEGKIERVGGGVPIEVDVRVIAATNIDIKKAVSDKKFREDLYYRLNVIPIELPPLRERKEDIPLFIKYFSDKFSKELNKPSIKIEPDAVKSLSEYDWPGNIRELANIIERMIAISKNDSISLEHMPYEIVNGEKIAQSRSVEPAGPLNGLMREYEKGLLIKALLANDWNQMKAARMLGIHRTTLISKMDSLDIKRSGLR
jgi:two-component system, NtrC family, response regulator AtoC